jgi:hypothetical protein
MRHLVVLAVVIGLSATASRVLAQPTDLDMPPPPPAEEPVVPPAPLPSEPPDEPLPPVETSPLPPVETSPVTPPPPADTPPPKPLATPVVVGVVLGGLDKIAARTARFEADINQQVFYNTLIVTARVCKTRPPEEPPESAAYVDIQERKPDGTTANIFSGWMFASSPALNALEHPVYDIWVISCKTVPPETAAPAPPNS